MGCVGWGFLQGTERAYARPIDNLNYMRWHLRFPMAMHSKGRFVLVENLELSASLSGLLRHFDGFELQANAAVIINQASSVFLPIFFAPSSLLTHLVAGIVLPDVLLRACIWGYCMCCWHGHTSREGTLMEARVPLQ